VTDAVEDPPAGPDEPPPSGGAIGLRRYLEARLLPLAALLFTVVTISAPLAYLGMGVGTVRANAEASARQVAVTLRDAAESRPLLWRYEAGPALEHVRAHVEEPGIERIALADPQGRAIDVGVVSEGSSDPLLWVSAPVTINEDHVATVWVGATLRQIEGEAALLLLGFALLALALAGAAYWLPARAISAAEARIEALVRSLDGSRNELASLNQTLEHQVAERSKQLADALEEVRALSQRAVRMQEDERRRLSRELHDSAGQTLTAVRINLQLIEQLSGGPDPVDAEALEALATKTISVADATLEEIRRVVDRLAPSILVEMGLQAAIERQCLDASERMGIDIDAEVEMPDNLGPAADIASYRLVQETLTNIARHAEATAVRVRVRPDERGGARIEIEDDGEGFDVQTALAKGRRGLLGMRERVELLGGELTLESTPGEGTRTLAWIPFAHADASGVLPSAR
jgi:signal transduction histidine kinase